MGYLLNGYRLDPRGRVEHRRFDSDDLFYGDAKANGWVDSPAKIQGGVQAIQAAAEAQKATAHTKGQEPAMTGVVYGEEIKPKRGAYRRKS
jgi:hypothetical protein